MKNNFSPRINKLLFALLGDMQLVDMWWDSPNRAFDMKTPAEVYKVDVETVQNYIMDHLQR